MTPHWLEVLAIVSLVTAACCAGIITIDILRGHNQHMWIMDLVLPITVLWSGRLGLWTYFRFGRNSGQEKAGKQKPFPAVVALAATHCGAGCTLGDMVANGFISPRHSQSPESPCSAPGA